MKLNGKEFKLEEIPNKNLLSLLEYLRIKPGTVAIEKNGEILDRNSWSNVELIDEDKIELIKFVGGG